MVSSEESRKIGALNTLKPSSAGGTWENFLSEIVRDFSVAAGSRNEENVDGSDGTSLERVETV